MIYDTLELAKALPDGIICVKTRGYFEGEMWVKTGDSTWAQIHHWKTLTSQEIHDKAEQLRVDRVNSVSPYPDGGIKVWLNERNVNKVLGMMAGTIERSNRLQRIVNNIATRIADLSDATHALRREVRD